MKIIRTFGLLGRIAAWALIVLVAVFFLFIIAAPDGQLENWWPALFKTDYSGSRIGAAEYLAFAIGIPAALLTSIVAIVIAAATKDSTKEQALLQKIELLDKKFSQAADSYFTCINAFEDFADEVRQAAINRDIIKDHVEILSEEKGSSSPDAKIIDQHTKWLDEAEKDFDQSFIRVHNTLQRIHGQDDLFWKKAEEIHISRENNWRATFDYVSSFIDTNFYKILHKPRDFYRRITFFAENTHPDELDRLELCIPSDVNPLEIAGALLMLVDEDNWLAEFEADFFEPDDDPVYFFNIGAAILVSGLNAIPKAGAIQETARRTFGSDAIGQKSYLSAIDVIRDYQSDDFRQYLNELNREPWRLVYRFNGQGNVDRPKKSEIPLRESNDQQAYSVRTFAGKLMNERPNKSVKILNNRHRKLTSAYSPIKAAIRKKVK